MKGDRHLRTATALDRLSAPDGSCQTSCGVRRALADTDRVWHSLPTAAGGSAKPPVSCTVSSIKARLRFVSDTKFRGLRGLAPRRWCPRVVDR